MDLLFNLNIDGSKTIDLRIIFKSRWIRPLMSDLKMVTSKIKSCRIHIKKQISTITKLELQVAVLANRMKAIISKSSIVSINKVHSVVKTQHQSGSKSIRKA